MNFFPLQECIWTANTSLVAESRFDIEKAEIGHYAFPSIVKIIEYCFVERENRGDIPGLQEGLANLMSWRKLRLRQKQDDSAVFFIYIIPLRAVAHPEHSCRVLLQYKRC